MLVPVAVVVPPMTIQLQLSGRRRLRARQ